MVDKAIYRLNDDISFRKCTLHDECKVNHGDCTNYHTKEISWKNYYFCNQDGIHLHCSKHPEIELDTDFNDGAHVLICPKCQRRINADDLQSIYIRCQKLLNIELFKNAKLIRLDDWYIPEVKENIKPSSDYWINASVKTDKDGDTIIILYIGHTGSKSKVQFFIKPEKGQLSNDHKDLDPKNVLSKIVVYLKNRTLSQEYEED